MKTIHKILTNIILLTSVVSCNGFLDMTPTDSVSDVVMWQKTETAEYAINYLYSYIYDVTMGQSSAGQTEAFTDQLKYGSYTYNSMCRIPSEVAYGEGTTLTATYVDAYLGTWGSMYSAIRQVNSAMNELEEYGRMSEPDKARLNAELRFLRGYLYFDLVKRYKQVILYDEQLDKIQKNKDLDTEENAWKFVYDDLKAAAENLPERTAAAGRLNKGAAWAFISRAMLYAGEWQKVYDATDSLAVMGYSLEKSYGDSYSKSIADGNDEAILQYLFSRSHGVTHSYDFYYTPGGDYTKKNEVGGGYAGPTQEMVESYELKTGGFPDWTPWHSASGVVAEPPYADLEPRFHATVLYNGASWKGRTIEPFIGGDDGWCEWRVTPEPNGRTVTGYYLRKGVDEGHDVISQSGSQQPLSIIRYGEVLLNRAEACWHLGDAAGANEAVRAIRERVGLPYEDKTGDALWAAIRQERKVELAFEGLWYWDLRRWNVAHKPYPEGLTGYQQHGLKIEKVGEGEFKYSYVSVDDQDRNFPEKLYQFPLPESELSSNGAIKNQFSQWN